MSKRNFFAQQWLAKLEKSASQAGQPANNSQLHSSPSSKLMNDSRFNLNTLQSEDINPFKQRKLLNTYLPDFTPRKQESKNLLDQSPETLSSDNENGFNPSKHFLGNWEGNALSSKGMLNLEKSLIEIYKHVTRSFNNISHFNRSLKNEIFNEFILFAQDKALNFSDFDNPQSFIAHLGLETSPYKEELDHFKNIFCFRTAVIYFFKLRFISIFAQSDNKELSDRHILNPNSYINTIFRKSSSNELYSQAFSPNCFSWYRPDSSLVSNLKELSKASTKYDFNEIIKSVSKSTNIEDTYSHSISHKNYGLFLNSLMISLPLWLESSRAAKKNLNNYGQSGDVDVMTCKFTGDYIESASVSHWLAQNNNKDYFWDHIICPSFRGQDFSTGKYLNLLNELQFLSFLTEFSITHNKKPIEFISSVVKRNFYNKKSTINSQESFLLQDKSITQSTYDRIILNLSNFPKNNPNHYLIHQVQDQLKSLKEGGFLYVMSSKKLFVPSLKDKIEVLLKKLKIEASISFENVAGKGEVPSYIYILRKKYQSEDLAYSHSPDVNKQTCLSFRVTGELSSFSNFSQITNEFQNFFAHHLSERPAMFNREFIANNTGESDKRFHFEFYQDAIVDGRLIRSSKKDSSSITHPTFFKNLLKSSVTLDYFFEIDALTNSDQTKKKYSPLLQYQMFKEQNTESYPYVCIIDLRSPGRSKLELIPQASYRAKLNQYGCTQCHYFGIRPKLHQINLNLFREYFDSNLGNQVINITFEGVQNKFKQKLNSLLIPKFFAQNKALPDHVTKGIEFLLLDKDLIRSYRPENLELQFKQIEGLIPSLLENYPASMFGLLCHFKNNMKEVLIQLQAETNVNSYQHPVIKERLIQTPSNSIYPNSKEIYTEFHIDHSNDIQLPLTKYVLNKDLDEVEGDFSVTLFNNDKDIITLHGKKETVSFVAFLLDNTIGAPILHILTGVKVPSNTALIEIFKTFNSTIERYDSLFKKVGLITSNGLTKLLNKY